MQWYIFQAITGMNTATIFVEESMAVLGASTEVSKLTVEIMEVFTGASGTVTCMVRHAIAGTGKS